MIIGSIIVKSLVFSDEVGEGFNEQYAIGGSSMRASPIQQAECLLNICEWR